MIVEFRAGVIELLASQSVPVHEQLPDDLAVLPCVVVGRVDVDEGEASTVADLSLDVWLIGRRTNVDDPQGQLDVLADSLLDTFGGWRGATAPNSQQLIVTSIRSRTLDVAQVTYPAYSFTLEASATTC